MEDDLLWGDYGVDGQILPDNIGIQYHLRGMNTSEGLPQYYEVDRESLARREGCWGRGTSPGYFSLDTSGLSRRPWSSYGVREPDEDDLRRIKILRMHEAVAEARAARSRARREAEARYRVQRRQALTAIAGGLAIMGLVIVAATI